MIIVSNTSPILNLAVIGKVRILEQLYHQVLVPDTVMQELLSYTPEKPWAVEVQGFSWIETRPVKDRLRVESLMLDLDAGEAEAIVLAMETKADLLLIDERLGRKAASRLGLKFIGLLGVLIEAKRRGLIASVQPVIDDMIARAGFWVDSELYDRLLKEAGE